MNERSTISSPSVASSSDVQEIAPGITMEVLDDGRILAFTVRTVDIDALAKYEKLVLEIVGAWPADKPFAHMQDFAHRSIGFTPTVRQVTARIANARPDLKTTLVALVVPQTFMAQIVRLAIHGRRPDPTNPNVKKVDMFYKRTDALAWLKTQLNSVPK